MFCALYMLVCFGMNFPFPKKKFRMQIVETLAVQISKWRSAVCVLVGEVNLLADLLLQIYLI